MDDKRNRIIKLIEYIKSTGIEINLGKNKARGHKGYFLSQNSKSHRIDIAKNLSENDTLSVIIHEFTHYIHSIYNKKLSDLNFLFNEYNGEINEELINVTVETVPKDFAKKLFDLKAEYEINVKLFRDRIKQLNPDFVITKDSSLIEKKIKPPLKYLLKYDNISFNNQKYSLRNIDNYDLSDYEKQYVLLKSAQRKQRAVQSRIRRINNYYNKPAELLARFMELYFLDRNKTIKIAPKAVKVVDAVIEQNKIEELTNIAKILK